MDGLTTPATPATPYGPYPVPINEVHQELNQQFQNFDDPEVYKKYLVDTIHSKSTNFAIRFGAEQARIATDLKAQDVATLIDLELAHREHEDLPVTWM